MAEDGKGTATLDPPAITQEDLDVANAKVKEFRANNIELRKKLDGLDPEEYVRLLKAEEERELADAEREAKYETAKQLTQDKHEKAQAELLGEKGELEKELRKLRITDVARAALEGVVLSPKVALPHVEKHMDLVDGKLVVTGLDGKETTLDGEGGLLEQMAADSDLSSLFPPSGATGGGAEGRKGAGGTGAIRSRADLKTSADKAAYISEHGLDKFQDLPVSID